MLALPTRFQEHLGAVPADLAKWYEDSAGSLGAVRDAEVLWFDPRTAAPIDQLLAAGHRLRWITTQNVGVDRLPLDELLRRRIRLTNAAGHYAIPIAEYIVMALLAWAKGMPELVRAQDREEWLAQAPRFRELAGGHALIVGYGGIGRAVGGRLRGLGLETVGVRTRARPPQVIGPDDWGPRLGEFDQVILCAPLTPRTAHLIGAKELAAMKPGAWLANTSRGALVDTDALVAALRSGHLGGAYLDVTDPEPLPPGHPLWKLPNVIVTPHTSWASAPFARRTSDFFVGNLARYQAGRRLRNVVKLRVGY